MKHPASGVAVTGLGSVCALGIGIEPLFVELARAKGSLKRLDLFEIDMEPRPLVGQVDWPLDCPARKGFRFSRTDRMAIVAAREAVAGCDPADADFSQTGVVFASTVAGLTVVTPQTVNDPYSYFRSGHWAETSAFPCGHVADAVAASLGFEGPRMALSVACASGAIALAVGARMILNGSANRVLAGGSDALCPFTISGFNALQALSFDPSMPFDTMRKGLNIGEGAGAVLLENLDRAIDRGARITALLTGWGMSNDAYHPTAPDPSGRGLAACIRTALSMADLQPGDIQYVNAHGTGTVLNDEAEARAYDRAFAARGQLRIPVSSTKSYMGHTLGAAGALEAVISILAVDRGLIPPTLRLTQPIESTAVDWVACVPRSTPVNTALSVSAGFGGSNVSLIFRRREGARES